MTTTCCICQSATLINRQNLRTLAALAGVLDVVLRDYGELQRQQSGPSEPWTLLGDLVEQLSEKPSLPSEGLAQGLALGSVRKVLTQTPQRASQRDHRGKTSCQLVVTSADPAALL